MSTIPPAVDTLVFAEYLKAANATPAMQNDIAAATAIAERRCQVGPIIIREVTSRVWANLDTLILPAYPVVEVLSVVGIGNRPTYDVADLDVDGDTGIVRLLNEYWFVPGHYIVTYNAGRYASTADVDPDVAEAVCIIGKQLTESRRRPQAMRDAAVAAGTPQGVPIGVLVPRQASEMLDGLRQSPVA